MVISNIIVYIMAVFFALGAIDRCLGNKFGLGAEFELGFNTMGRVALGIAGLICAAPAIARIIQPVVVPLYNLLGADAAMFSGSFLAPDSGGYAIAVELASDPSLAFFSGIIVAATMGAVVSFTIPLAYGMIEKRDTKYLATGILSGFIFDPLACFFGGLAMGLPAITAARNLVPVLIIALIIVAGLFFIPEIMIKAFRVFARFLLILVTIGLILAAVEKMTGLVIVEGLNPISDAFVIVGSIILILSGTLPCVYVMRKVFKRPLAWVGKKIGINDVSVISILVSTASIIPAFAAFKDMNIRGKVVLAAVTASMSNLLGAHFGFTSSIDQAMLTPMLFAKVLAGIFAVPTAIFFSQRLFGEEIRNEKREALAEAEQA